MILHLGVYDIKYEEDGKSTVEVATALEERYGIMAVFFEVNAQRIADMMAADMRDALEEYVTYGRLTPASSLFAGAMSQIHDLFVKFIITEQMNGRAGIPTLAAMEGVRTRMKLKKGAPRASFDDTGTYMAAMTAWVTEVMNNASSK